MNLDRWVSWRLGAILLTSAVIGLLITLAVIRERFDTLEIWLTEQQLARVERVLEQELFDMERISADYAQWDDTVAYLQEKRPEFVVANFPRNTGDNLNVDAVIIRDADDAVALAVALSGEADFLAWPQSRVDAVHQALEIWPKDGRYGETRGSFLLMVGRSWSVGRQ